MALEKNLPKEVFRDLQQVIIDFGSADRIFRFAYDLKKGIDVKRLQEALIKAPRNGKYLALFARHIPGADVTRLRDHVLSIGNPADIYTFAMEVRGLRCVSKGSLKK